MSGDNQDSVPITISGFSVSIRQWNSGTLLTTGWKFKFMILNLFCFSNLFFFMTGVEVTLDNSRFPSISFILELIPLQNMIGYRILQFIYHIFVGNRKPDICQEILAETSRNQFQPGKWPRQLVRVCKEEEL